VYQLARALWPEVAASGPGADPALRSFRDEAVSWLETRTALRRVLAAAAAPQPPRAVSGQPYFIRASIASLEAASYD
jgi:hypothetical protein